MDKRSLRSKKALQDGLLSLLRKIPFDEITIQVITDEADTARVTFYRHYGTKEELLADTIERDYERIRNILVNPKFEHLLDFQQPSPLYIMFSQIEQNRILYKNLYTSTANTLIQRRARQLIIERLIQSVQNSPQYADLPIVLIANHMATVTIGNMWWWLSEDLPYSAEYMARLTHWMGLSGAMTMIGRGDLITMPPPNTWQIPNG